MKPILLIRFALLLAPLAVLSAAEPAPIKPGTVFEYAVRPVPSYRVTQEDKGKETLELVEPEFSEKASEAERDRYVREVVFPKVQADATAGRMPAVWEIGYFYLNGWGVPLDLQQAEAAFRAGPESERGRGLWRVGQAYRRTNEFAKAEVLLLESLDAGCNLAARDTAHLASGYLHGLWKLKPDPAKAEALLQKVGSVYPEDADCS